MSKLTDYIASLSPEERELYGPHIEEALEIEARIHKNEKTLQRTCDAYASNMHDLARH